MFWMIEIYLIDVCYFRNILMVNVILFYFVILIFELMNNIICINYSYVFKM